MRLSRPERDSVMVQGERVWISGHAVERYAERVRPTLEASRVKAEMRRVLPLAGEYVLERPEWSSEAANDPRARSWVLLGGDIAFPVANRVLLTCVTRGEPSPLARQERAARRRERGLRSEGSRARPTGRLGAEERKRYRDRRDAKGGVA